MTTAKKITVVDEGVANLYSVRRAIESMGGVAEITNDPDVVRSAEKLLLPGVGAFKEAMDELKKRKLDVAIKAFAKTGKPLLGICLGMQLLFSESYEFGTHHGLDLIQGKVVRFQDTKEGVRFKIPQIGWNQITLKSSKSVPLLKDIPQKSFFYFVHSYICIPEDAKTIVAESTYGLDRYCAVVHHNNIWGCQFHPEKSGPVGLQIYKNFLSL